MTGPAPERCVHHLVRDQVARTPDAVAVVLGDRSLTYRELDRRARRLAAHLRRLGVGPDRLVGLCVERSLDMAVGLLGILEAGGAYVPLDPAYPRERLAWILEDTRAPVLVTQRALAGALPAHDAHVVYLDDDPGDDLAAELPDDARGEHLAYVIYTSGSTGRPKGICLPHRALVNLLEWHDRTLLRGARTLQFASLCFDASFHEMFAAWSSGGTVYLIPEATRRDVAALTRAIADHAIEKVILPVVVVQQIAEHVADAPERLRSLRELTTTGEQLHVTQPVVRLFQRLPGCAFHNHYGPSETHVVTAYTLPPDPATWPTHPPIGRAIDHTTLHVLDERGEPVPDGVPGELYIGGVSLARGYLGRDDLTAERFVPDRFDATPGARLYRTGDLVRVRDDGELEFLGRLDHQVKIRGHRVELGEVEGTLSRHPRVVEAVVLAREDRPGERRLIAYVVPDRAAPEDAPPLTAELRAHLRDHLPDYMVPAAFVVVDAMPLTANGKIDRAALPPPGSARPDLAQPYVPPRTPLEATLAEIWEEALGLDQVGVHDDFLALGGDSLSAVGVFARLQARLGVEVSFQALFAHPTVAALARHVAGAAAARHAPIRPVPRGGLVPASFAQERVWFLHQLAPGSGVYNCVDAFRVTGPLDRAALDAALRELVRRHEILRTTFPELRGEPYQQIHDELDVRLEWLELDDLPADVRDAAVTARLAGEAGHAFDLARGPLIRAGAIRLADDAHVVWLDLHHIITDGRSMEVLFRELAALYGEASGGPPARLAPVAVQYADYAAWQRRVLDDATVAELVAWWRDRLAGVPPLVELPADRRRPAVQSFRGAGVPLRLDRDLTEALRALGAAHGTTLTMAVLAGFATLVHRYTEQDDLVIGVPTLGRDTVETEAMLGFFVNTLPVRLQLGGAPSFAAVLDQVRRACLDAFEHDALPFERIVHELRIDRSASHNPLVQVAIAPQPPGERDLRLPGLAVEHLGVATRRAVCDLTLYVWDTPDGLTATLEYATDLFDAATIERLAGHLRRLLAGAVATPGAPVTALPMLGDDERRQVIVAWNDTAAPAAHDHCYHELVAEQAARTPDAIAVVEPSGRALTYAALDARANQLAHHLRGLGVEPDTIVALCTERSVDWLVGVLGILKAGGAYLPLDPAYPRARLALMLADAAPHALVTHAHLEGTLPAPERVVRLDADAAAIARAPTTPPVTTVAPHHLAYVIYTSGSTGTPKGVMVEHRNLVHVTEVQRRALELGPDHRVLQFSSPCFDASVWEYAAALTVGATVCLLPPGPAPLGPELGRLVRDLRVDTANLVPSVLRDLPVELAGGLRTIVAAGERCDEELVARWAPGRRFLNGYGPTECTVCVTLADCEPDGAPPPIGRPQANIRAYVLDRDLQPVPVGVPGELFVGGDGVARGYLRRPELTAERFLPDPFDPSPGRRMYRTGDVVRWRRDGQLEFLGRRDAQVKVRGFRIELGEIEVAAREHPDVADVAVIVREDAPGDRRLTAYVVATDAPAADTVTEHLTTWQQLYDDVFDGVTADAPDARFTGWNSSYTGRPLGGEEMRAWRDATVERIAALSPRRVWEIGCGTGLLLLPLAPGCEAYLGTDLSERELALLGADVAAQGLTGVTLERRRADDFTGIAPASFDAVVVNSVVQYFPDLAYLREVLRGAIAAARPGGAVFVGDVRSLPLLEAFHASVAAFRAADDTPASALRREVARAIATEPELVVDPALFHALVADHPEVAWVELAVKRGRHDNELTAFRYDVTVHVGAPVAPVEIGARETFAALGGLAAVERWLGETAAAAAELVEIPDARTRRGLALAGALATFDGTAAALRAAADAAPPAIHPEDVWALADRLGMRARLTPSRRGPPGTFDALFERDPAAPVRPWPGEAVARGELANDPLRRSRERGLPARLRGFLGARLPAHMVPADVVVLDALPLAPGGKLDRAALPAPGAAAPEPAADHVAPRDRLEADLAALWAEVIGVPRVGVHDDFFDLGGDSMMVSWLVVRIQDQLGIDLPMRALYEAPTIAELARLIESDRRAPGAASLCYTPTLRLDEEADLDPAIAPPAAAVDLDRPPTHLLLTGATGFVGAFLLAELLATTDARVTCLVRARDEAAARARLRRTLDGHRLPVDDLDARVEVVVGDLGAARLGLPAATFDRLADTIDAIVHNGAKVDHVRGYLEMKPANVVGTREILRLACHRRLAPVHLVSTLATVYPPDHQGAGVVREDAPAGPLERLPNGYMQSKCVAEALVTEAIARGVPATIFRLGAITGHSRTGACNPGDFTYSALRSTIELGFADDLNADLTLTPVDFAVRAIVAIVRSPRAPRRVYHVTHPRPWFWLDLVEALRRRGHAVETRSYAACMAGLVELARQGVDTPMLSFLPFITQRVPGSARYVAEDYHAPVRWDCEHLLAVLTELGVEGPPGPEALLDTYLGYLERNQILTGPRPGPTTPTTGES